MTIQTPRKVANRKPAVIILFIVLSIFFFLILNLYFNTSGAYSKELNVAFIFLKGYKASTELDVAPHEIGHYVYYKKLSQEQRDEYRAIYFDSKHYVTEYAKTNEVEDFAEMFRAMTVCTMDINRLKWEDYNKQQFFINNFEDMMK